MNVVGLWTFGRQVRTKVHAHLSPREVDTCTKLGLFFISSFTSRALSRCVVPFNSWQQCAFKRFYKQQLKFSFRMKEARRSQILLPFSIYTHVLNLETYWWLRVIDTRYHLGYHVTYQSVSSVVPLTRSRPIAVEKKGHNNDNNVGGIWTKNCL